MLRAGAWTHRGHPFVCASCRNKLSPAQERRRALSNWTRLPNRTAATQLARCTSSRSWGTRALSTTPSLCNSGENNEPPKTAGFTGAFAASKSRSWGSFASGPGSSAAPPSDSNSDGLLPHEREARQRMAPSAPTPPSQSNPGESTQNSNRNTRVQQNKNPRSGRRPSDAQATMSRSVLADVFRANREPRAPPTPKAWSTGEQREDTGRNKVGSANLVPGKASPGWDSFSRRNTTSAEGNTKGGDGGASKPSGWGAFSTRKTQTTNAGNESTAWSEMTKSRREQPALHSKNKAGIRRKPDTADGAAKPNGAPNQDFWGELENRVTNFKDKAKARKDGAASDGRARRFKGASISGKGFSATAPGNEADDIPLATDFIPAANVIDNSGNDRRKSRFDMEEEEESTQSRKLKKAKKTQRGRRNEQDQDEWDEEAVERWETKQRRKAEKEAARLEELERKKKEPTPIFLPEYINVFNLAQALRQQADTFLRDMEEMGFENVTNDTIMTGDTAALVAMEYGFEPTVDTGSQRDLRPRPVPADVSTLPSRPPVVTIMGHVDHGKTTLLDWLRKSSIAAQEHGGITQHIGAFVVKMSSGKAITFLDTPGHAAFLSMRQRGANVTDIVVLVVAADDSVKPQTIEALKHATAAKVPIIVAINKIDKEDARIDQVKADLSRHGVEIEDYGGDVQVACVSGKTGKGMDDLEENIVTLSEILDVRAEEDGMAEGWILESSVKQDGKVATVLVKRGTLRPGDLIVAGKTWARIRVLRNEAGVELTEALPGTPVEILGWRELPSAGAQVLQSPDEDKAKTAVEYRREMAEREETSVQVAEQEQRQREKAAADAAAAAAAEAGIDAVAEPKEPGILYQNFTIKADVAGSVEAVCGSILELGNHEVRPRILQSSAGPISESDVDHAATSRSVIVSFNNAIPSHIKSRAEAAGVRILDHSVIYHTVDAVKDALSDLLPMNISTRVTGEADILQVFPINLRRRVFKNIGGCKVRNGSIKRSAMVKVLRKGQVVFEGKIDTLKHVKKDVMEMGKGTECGIGLEDFEDLRVDDQIQTFEEVKEKRSL